MLHVNVAPFNLASIGLSVQSESQMSVQNNTDFSILSFRNVYGFNPPIIEGQMRSLKLKMY